MNATVAVLLAMTIKHFICDGPLQAFPWMYKNKGTYGHLGGIAHALIHVIGTEVALSTCQVQPELVLAAALIDGGVHYHIDWAKMRIGAAMNWRPDNSECFWILLLFDQLLHSLTYFAIALAVT